MKEHSPNNPEKMRLLEPQRQPETEQPSFVFAHEEALLLEYLDEVQQSFTEPAEEIDSWNDSIKTCMRNMEQDMNDLSTLAPDEESRYESALDVQSQYSRLLEISQEITHSTGIFNQTQKKRIALLFSIFEAMAEKVLKTTFPEIVGQDPQKSFLELKQSLQEFIANSNPYQRLVSGLEKKIVAKKVDSWIRGLKWRYLDNVREFLIRHDIAGLTGNVAKLSAVLGIGLAAMDCASVQKGIHDTAHNPNLDGHDTDPKEPEGTDIAVDYNQRGEVFLRHGNLKLGLVCASKLGLLHDPNDTRSKSMELLISGFIFDRSEGVNYEIRDPEGFQSFVEQEAKNLIAKINSAGAQTPIEWSRLKEDELVQLSLLIVQQNLTYDHLSTNYPDHVIDESVLDEEAREQIAEARQEDEKINKMPLDEMLMEYHQGVCRHYAALVAKVSQVLKQSSGSPYLNNIEVLPFRSHERNHAYNIVLEQHDKDTILAYFLDITSQKDKFALSELEALSGRGRDYLSVEEFLNKREVLAPLFSPEELTLALEELVKLNQTNLPKRQLWADILADRYYQEAFTENDNEMAKKAEYYYKIAIDAYKEIIAYNKTQATQSQDDPIAFHRMYDIGSALTRYLTLLERKKNFDTAEAVLLDDDLFVTHHFAPGIRNESHKESVQYNTTWFIHQLLLEGDYQRIIDFNKKLTYNPGLKARADILEAFLALEKGEEALQYAEKMLSTATIFLEKHAIEAPRMVLEKFSHKNPWRVKDRRHTDFIFLARDIWKFYDELYAVHKDPQRTAPFEKAEEEIDWQATSKDILSDLFKLAAASDQGDASCFVDFMSSSSNKIDSLVADGVLTPATLHVWEDSIASRMQDSLQALQGQEHDSKSVILQRRRLDTHLDTLLSFQRMTKVPIGKGVFEEVPQGALFDKKLPLVAIEVKILEKNREGAFNLFQEFFLDMNRVDRSDTVKSILDGLINRKDYREHNMVDRAEARHLDVTNVMSWFDTLEDKEHNEHDKQEVFEVYAYTGKLLMLLDAAAEGKGITFIKQHFLDDIGTYFYRIYYSNRAGNQEQMSHLFAEAREYYEKGYPVTNYFKIVLVESYIATSDWKTAETIWNTEYDKFAPAITMEDNERIPKEIERLKGKKK